MARFHTRRLRRRCCSGAVRCSHRAAGRGAACWRGCRLGTPVPLLALVHPHASPKPRSLPAAFSQPPTPGDPRGSQHWRGSSLIRATLRNSFYFPREAAAAALKGEQLMLDLAPHDLICHPYSTREKQATQNPCTWTLRAAEFPRALRGGMFLRGCPCRRRGDELET